MYSGIFAHCIVVMDLLKSAYKDSDESDTNNENIKNESNINKFIVNFQVAPFVHQTVYKIE